MAEKDPIYNLTEPVVMAHPGLFQARAIGPKGKESGKPKFSANFLFKPESLDLAGMKALCAEIAKAKWPGRALSELKFPFTLGDKLAAMAQAKGKGDKEDYNKGFVVLAARSLYDPRLAIIENGRIVDLEGDARVAAKPKFYFGVQVLGQFKFQAYDGVGANPDGVTAYMNQVLSTGKGERIGGSGVSAAETFKDYMGKHSAVDPTAGLDDEIVF